jgi:hypothetical protein
LKKLNINTYKYKKNNRSKCLNTDINKKKVFNKDKYCENVIKAKRGKKNKMNCDSKISKVRNYLDDDDKTFKHKILSLHLKIFCFNFELLFKLW